MIVIHVGQASSLTENNVNRLKGIKSTTKDGCRTINRYEI